MRASRFGMMICFGVALLLSCETSGPSGDDDDAGVTTPTPEAGPTPTLAPTQPPTGASPTPIDQTTPTSVPATPTPMVPTPTSAAGSSPTPVPTQVPDNTEAPDSTATPEPGQTPAATPAGTPEPGATATPAPTPEPTATPDPNAVLKNGPYMLHCPYYVDLSQDSSFTGNMPYEISLAFTNVYNDRLEGNQYFIFYKTEEGMNCSGDACDALVEGVDYCTMPEDVLGIYLPDYTYEGCPPNKPDCKCPDCFGVWDMTFSPIEAETTCSDEMVEYWNGPTMYEDWFDTWGFMDFDTGLPKSWESLQSMYESMDAQYVTYSPFYAGVTGVWGAEYVFIPYCNVYDCD